MVGIGKNTVEIIIAARDRTRAAFTKVNTQMRTLGASSTRLNTGMGTLKSSFMNLRGAAGKLVTTLGPLGLAAVAAAAAIAIASIGIAAVKAFAEFEDAMASVRKTTGFTKAEIKVLGDAINDLALRIPVAQTELAGIATVAGQLGIQSKEDILSFTETVAMMTTAFDMSAESVAIAMAKLGKIYDIPIEQTSNLGSAINVLGNTTAASEAQLLAYSMALGPTGQQLGFTATEVLSLGASMISMGMDASNAGTRLNRAFSMIGQNLDELAKFMGVSTEEFTASFEAMPMDTFISVIDKLSQVEGKLKANTIASELFNEIGAKAIKTIAGDVEGLQTNLANSAKGFGDNTSLAEEFAAKTDTLNAKFAIFGNTVESFKIKIGGVLAPLTGTLVEGARLAIVGLGMAFDALQKVSGVALDLIFIKIKILREFFEGLFTPIIAALAPLRDALGGTTGHFDKLKIVLSVVSDIITILAGAARMLGEAIGNLVAQAITPLIAKLQEGGEMLSCFYEKLGPIKTLIEGGKGLVGAGIEGLSDLADSSKDAKPPIEEVTEALEVLKKEGSEAPKAVAVAWALAVKSFQDGAGTYKDAIGGIEERIAKLTEEWMTATDKRKVAIEKEVVLLKTEEDGLRGLKKTAEDALSGATTKTEEATQKMKEFSVTIGDTTIEFKGAAAEVVKNADAYAKLQKSAQTLIDMDWSVFTEFEAALPNIEAGIIDMESSFVGLKTILEDNIGSLENVKESVMDISEIAAPFLEAGFLDGITSIGSFAGSLKDAGAAINTFSSLQDVSIEGCINFSLHVRDMVSALQILEDQMEDLVPSFGEMDSLITDVLRSFVAETKSLEKGTALFSSLEEGFKMWTEKGVSFSDRYHTMSRIIVKSLMDMGVSAERASQFFSDHYDELERMAKGSENADEFLQKVAESEIFLGMEVDITTASLKAQTGQLAKITDSLQPYLEFMRTLNELAALSTLSTVELNAGLNSIKDTLVNLGTALSSFDLRPVMESLFGMKIKTEEGLDSIFSGGKATGFMDVMEEYEWKFNILIGYVTRLSSAITDLVSAFETLGDINESVLADQTKLKEVFEGIVTVMSNFSAEMGEAGFADSIAKGMEAMIKSADPLITYFDANNASVLKFNNTLGIFKTAITHVVGVMDLLKDMSEMALPLVDALEAGFDKAAEAISRFDEALLKHLGISTEGHEKGMFEVIDEEAFSSNILTSIIQFADNWSLVEKALGESFEVFEDGINTITTLITNITSLASAFESMKDISLPSATEMGRVFDEIEKSITEFTSVVRTEFPKITSLLVAFDEEWVKHKETIDDTLPSLKEAINTYTTLISLAISLTSAYDSLAVKEGELAKIRVISAEDLAATIKDVPDIISQMKGLLEEPIWGEVIAELSEFAPEWDEISEGVKESIDSFSAAVGAFSAIISAAVQLTDTFTDMEDIVVISVDQMIEAFEDIPEVVDEVTKYLATHSFAIFKSELNGLDEEWQKHKVEMEKSMEAFNATIDTFSSLISKVLSLSSALDELKDMSVLSVRDIDEALKNIPFFLDHFVDALALNMGAIKEALGELEIEWSKHEEEMGDTMPSFDAASKNMGTLIGTILSLNAALEELRSMGTIREREFNRGFENLTKSIANFAVSLATNVDALVYSLQKLRIVWVENEAVLLPLMKDFAIITDNLWGVAHNANRMAKEFNNISKNAGTLEKGFKSLIEFIDQVVKGTKEFYTAEAADELARFIDDVGDVIKAFVDLEIELKGAMDTVKGAIGTAVDNIEGKIRSLDNSVKDAFHWGANMMGGFISGIYSMEDDLALAAARMARIVEDYLGAASPTKLGPLSDLDKWPQNLVRSYSSGIEAEMHTLNSSFVGLAPGMSAGVAGGNKNVNFYVTQHITDRATADYANHDLERLMHKHTVM